MRQLIPETTARRDAQQSRSKIKSDGNGHPIRNSSELLVNSGDERALAEAILLILSDAALRSGLADAGRWHAEVCFDLHRQTALLEEKYLEVLSRR
jgi:glycosyltransferase involved in cell wall biosynthesis